jgi:hypothetical protein
MADNKTVDNLMSDSAWHPDTWTTGFDKCRITLRYSIFARIFIDYGHN